MGAGDSVKARGKGVAGDATPVVIRVQKTAEIVAGHIRGLIVRGELAEGDFLQSEAQLMERFATSRPTLREAFRILENERMISVSRGSRTGARVHRPGVESVARHAGFTLQAEGTTLGDIYAARLAIEPFAAGLAAEGATASKVKQLRAAVAELKKALAEKSLPEYRVLVARFHLAVVDASGNKTLSLMIRMLQGVIERHQARFRDDRSTLAALKGDARDKFYKDAMRSFDKIVDLIEMRDRDGAERHWRGHVATGNKVWLSGYDPKEVVDVLE